MDPLGTKWAGRAALRSHDCSCLTLVSICVSLRFGLLVDIYFGGVLKC